MRWANPTGFHLTPGQAHDLDGTDALLADTPTDTVTADKAYDHEERVIATLHKVGKNVVIPSKRCCKQPVTTISICTGHVT